MKKLLVFAFTLTMLVGCKTQQAAVATEAAAGSDKTAIEIIEGHYKNPKNFETLHINASAKYKDEKQSQSVSAEIRIKKDETILVSIKFLGITMAKAIITPTRVSYYEKINNTYFDGNYAALSKWLGTELDYSKVQNMLIGEALDDLTKGSYKSSIDADKYKLTGKAGGGILKEFLFEGANYLLKDQIVSQGGQQPRSLHIEYPAHSSFPQATLPAQIKIEAEQKDKVNINIEYTSVKFDEKLTFPYDVPEGFEQIFIE